MWRPRLSLSCHLAKIGRKNYIWVKYKNFGAPISPDKISLPMLFHTYAFTDCFALIWPLQKSFSHNYFERQKKHFPFFAASFSSSSQTEMSHVQMIWVRKMPCIVVHVVDGSGPSNVTCHGNGSVFSLWKVLQCVKNCRFQLNLGQIPMRCYRPIICILNTFAIDWWKLLVLSR